MLKKTLNEKVALVTGGAKGYGRGIASELVRAGATVYVTGREGKALNEFAADIGVHAAQADVTSAEDWERVVALVVEEQGRLDILINNAGAGVQIANVEEQSVDAITQSISVNLVAPILGARAVVPVMKKRKSGTIINISSICERESWPGWAVYGAAKAGLHQFSEGLYVEVRAHGIRVTTITPSWGLTDFLSNASIEGFDEETSKRVTHPEELGRVIVNVCALPPHLCALDLTLLPLVQEIVPL